LELASAHGLNFAKGVEDFPVGLSGVLGEQGEEVAGEELHGEDEAARGLNGGGFLGTEEGTGQGLLCVGLGLCVGVPVCLLAWPAL
jgi:hypothetical protein